MVGIPLLIYDRATGEFDLFDDNSRDDDRRVNGTFSDSSDYIVDIREYDVPYHVRFMIDMSMTLQLLEIVIP